MKQQEMNIVTNESTKTVDEYKFEPIRGQPMLRWNGKRGFTSTQYFPAQEKERHGDEVNGWMNRIYWGDNLQVMSHLLKEFRGKIDLIYIDPPFDSKADYKKKIELRGKKVENDHSSFEDKQYTDIWTNDEYLQFMYERLILCRELMADDGCLFLHCDWHMSHYLRLILDEIMGRDNFVNELVWCRNSSSSAKAGSTLATSYLRAHDIILLYRKTTQFCGIQRNLFTSIEYSDRVKNSIAVDEDGNAVYKRGKGTMGGVELKETVEVDLDKGMLARDWWTDIPIMRHNSFDNVNYPTQKPEKLLERIIGGCSNPGDIVFDCFMGSGTTQAVAMKLGRRFIGADINLGAIQTTTKRLIGVAKELGAQLPDAKDPKYMGFTVYNVNNYDVFRNPVEARDLLVQALELQPLPKNGPYDGEKDGAFYKIMPVNRLATKADLNEIVANFDIKSAEKKQLENPGKPVMELKLVCMGHEPDLAASLKQQFKSMNIDVDVEVLDILRDKSDLVFKKDSEADIDVKGKKLIIKEFYPMNLLKKLSLQKSKVEDWRELVDSVMIDFNYDGVVFTPSIVDVPKENEFVKGEYDIPDGAGTIKVKITDLLSESLEAEVK